MVKKLIIPILLLTSFLSNAQEKTFKYLRNSAENTNIQYPIPKTNINLDTIIAKSNTYNFIDSVYTSGTDLVFHQKDGTTITVAGGAGGGTVTSVSGTASRVTSTGGATPVIDISAAYVGQTSLTTLGTIATGVWNGTSVGAIYGGTGQTSYTTGDMNYASATNTLSKLAIGSTGNVLTVAGGIPSWAAPAAAAAGTLTGTTLASNVVTSSLTAVGTIATGVWNGTLVAGQYGGTGVANTGKTITVSGNTTIGSSTHTVAFTTSGNTSVTLPTTGTLSTLDGSETLTNKTIAAGSNTISGLTNTNLSGSAAISNANLANSAITIDGTSVSLGGTSDGRPTIASVAGSNVTTTLATAVDITGLSVAVAANKKYKIVAVLWHGCDNTGGIQFAINGPASSALLSGQYTGSTTAANVVQTVRAVTIGSLTSATAFNRVNAATGMTTLIAFVTTSGTAGNITMQYASATATQTSTIFIGSTLEITEVH